MDFMASYGLALIIIIFAVATIYLIGNSNNNVFQNSCTGYSGFSCSTLFLNDSGILNITISQDTGADILVKGIACSTAQSSVGVGPAYGNYGVYNSFYYYPNSEMANGININTGNSASFDLYCYNSVGVSTEQVQGNDFSGYVWINYTVINTDINETELMAAFTTTYTK
ncbi:MAG: hypothetical protein ACP5M9_02540 [Candidatus Micrarchaeia archaeon]